MGARVGTKHRCPCRTMGDRPALDLADAVASLTDSKGKLDTTHDIDRVRLAPRKIVDVETYAELEAPLLARLAAGEDALTVLAAKPFPKLKGESFAVVGKDFIKERDGSRFGAALGWFGDAILHLVSGTPARPPALPAQREADARAHDAGRERAARRDHREQAERFHRTGCGLPAVAGRVGDLRRRKAVLLARG